MSYIGIFHSTRGTRWKVEIIDSSPVVRALELEGEDPLTIEWPEAGKEECICPSSATLRLLSPGDRTYAHLFDAPPGTVRLRVTRGESPYWEGILDSEFYEEPYSRAARYPVLLTFSDFGAIGRGTFTPGRYVTLRDLAEGVARHLPSLETEWTCALFPLAYHALTEVSVEGTSFEPGASLVDAIRVMFTPLGLRIIQRAGKLIIHDLSGVNSPLRTAIDWTRDDQMLSADRWVSEVAITFSPRDTGSPSASPATGVLATGAIAFTGTVGMEAFARAPLRGHTEQEEETEPIATVDGYGKVAALATNTLIGVRAGEEADTYEAFYNQAGVSRTRDLVFLAGEGEGVAGLGEGCLFFKRLSTSGSGEEGVAWMADWQLNSFHYFPAASSGSNELTVFSAPPVRLTAPPKDGFRLHISLDMLADVRYNPFCDLDGDWETEAARFARVKARTAWAFVPIGLEFAADGGPVYHYTNRAAAEGMGVPSEKNLLGEWVLGPATPGDAWLEYYDARSPDKATALLQWSTNRPLVGRPDHRRRTGTLLHVGIEANDRYHLYDYTLSVGTGQPVPYPPGSGTLSLVVYAGLRCYAFGEDADFGTMLRWGGDGMHKWIRWLLYRNPRIEVRRTHGDLAIPEVKDVVVRGTTASTTREILSIDTRCGTYPEEIPSLPGLYLKDPKDSPGVRIERFGRAGDRGTPERLLCNALLSQYAARRRKLSGSCAIGGRLLYTDRTITGPFLLMGAVEHPATEEMEATFVELAEENFTPQ